MFTPQTQKSNPPSPFSGAICDQNEIHLHLISLKSYAESSGTTFTYESWFLPDEVAENVFDLLERIANDLNENPGNFLQSIEIDHTKSYQNRDLLALLLLHINYINLPASTDLNKLNKIADHFSQIPSNEKNFFHPLFLKLKNIDFLRTYLESETSNITLVETTVNTNKSINIDDELNKYSFYFAIRAYMGSYHQYLIRFNAIVCKFNETFFGLMTKNPSKWEEYRYKLLWKELCYLGIVPHNTAEPSTHQEINIDTLMTNLTRILQQNPPRTLKIATDYFYELSFIKSFDQFLKPRYGKKPPHCVYFIECLQLACLRCQYADTDPTSTQAFLDAINKFTSTKGNYGSKFQLFSNPKNLLADQKASLIQYLNLSNY